MTKSNHNMDTLLKCKQSTEVEAAERTIVTRILDFLKTIIYNFSGASFLFDNKLKSQKKMEAEITKTTDGKGEYISFTFFFIALAAKLSQVDSPANEEEIEAFIKKFPVEKKYNLEIRSLFHSACKDVLDANIYARKIAEQFPGNTSLYRQVVVSLITIACIDGPINTKEMDFLSEIAKNLYISSKGLEQIIHNVVVGSNDDPYSMLGVTKAASKAKVMEAYKKLARKYHPDSFIRYKNVDSKYLKLMQEKFNNINNAYQLLVKKKV
jgi:DnaJ like chaperone protein